MLTLFNSVREIVNVSVLVSAKAFVKVTSSRDSSGSLNASTQ